MRNKDLQKQHDDLSSKIKELSQASKTGQKIDVTRMTIVSKKGADEAEVVIPQEILDLKKELRRTQKYLGGLRKQWQDEKKETSDKRKTVAAPSPQKRSSAIIDSYDDSADDWAAPTNSGRQTQFVPASRQTTFHPASRQSTFHPPSQQTPMADDHEPSNASRQSTFQPRSRVSTFMPPSEQTTMAPPVSMAGHKTMASAFSKKVAPPAPPADHFQNVRKSLAHAEQFQFSPEFS